MQNVISAKTVDRAFATVGDILTYTVTLNAGSVSADSPTFVDTNQTVLPLFQILFLLMVYFKITQIQI